MPRRTLVYQYLRAIAKRALPIFQSNNFTYLGGVPKSRVGDVPTEEDLFNVLVELYKDVQDRVKRYKRLISKQASLGRFTVIYDPKAPIGINVLLNINDHDWRWHPENVFKERNQVNSEESICQKTN